MTFKATMQFVGKIVLSSLVSAGILLLIYSFTKRDSEEFILQSEVDSKATKIELSAVKYDLSKKIEDGDDHLQEEIDKVEVRFNLGISDLKSHIDTYHSDVIKMIDLATKD